MTGLLPVDVLALLKREYMNHAQVAERQAKDKRPYAELDRAYGAAVSALGKALEHIEALEEVDAADIAYAGLNYVDKHERWHDAPDDRAAFDAMCEAQTALRDAAVLYSAGVE